MIRVIKFGSPNFLLSSWGPAECSSHQGAAPDTLHLALQSCSGHGQVRPGGEHQHLGSPYGEHHAMAAAAGHHPDKQSKLLLSHNDSYYGQLRKIKKTFPQHPWEFCHLSFSPHLQAWHWLTCPPVCSWTSCNVCLMAGTWLAWARCVLSWGTSLRTASCGRDSASTTSQTGRQVETKHGAFCLFSTYQCSRWRILEMRLQSGLLDIRV